MRKYPDFKMIAGMSILRSVVLGSKGVVYDSIQVVGVDSSQEAVQLMENGVFRGLVVQKSFKMGYMGVKETVSYAAGQKLWEECKFRLRTGNTGQYVQRWDSKNCCFRLATFEIFMN